MHTLASGTESDETGREGGGEEKEVTGKNQRPDYRMGCTAMTP